MDNSTTRAHSTPRRPHLMVRVVGALMAALLATSLVGATQTAGAVQPGTHGRSLVSQTNPASWTPHVLDGYVESIAEVGQTVVLGGNFTQFRPAGSDTVVNRSHLFSFQKGTGEINAGFAPVVNGEVTSVVSAGDGQSVFVAGGFSSLNGQTVRSLAKVNLATGQRVTQFNPPAFNGRISDIALRNGKLYVSGRFTTVGGQAHTLFAAVDATTGALDPNVKATFSDPRRSGTLSIVASDITPDGSKLVAIGNFTKVNGLDRYQIAVLDLTTSPISVADWSTVRYGDGCNPVFQSYMRDIDISPDGSYFGVVTTGAYASPTSQFLCDTVARWELGSTGANQQPTWVDYTGGDTTTEVAITDTAVYVGGHYSYMNNPYIADSIAAGAAPRESLSAHDPRTGVVLDWNPGRTRGYGVYGFLATNEGLWIGSDTDRIANEQYRGRIAFLPVDPNNTLPTEFVGELPAKVVSLGVATNTNQTRSRTFTGSPSVGGATEPWTPADLPGGTALWLDADAASTFSTSGSNVTEWRDRSGNGRAATQSTNSNRPVRTANTLGGRASVVFDGSNDRLNFTGSFLAGTNYTVAAAVARTSNKSSNFFLGGTSTSTNANLHMGWRSNTSFTHAQYNNDYDMTVPGYTAPEAQVVVSRSSTSGKSTSIQGAPAGSSTSGSLLSDWSSATVGRFRSNYFAGRVGEVVVATSSVSDADRQRLEGYLAHKWGTTGSLPADHPYKTTAPQKLAAPVVDPTSTSTWSNLRGAFMIDGNLYTGWADGTFKVQTYDGTTFGPQTNVPLQLVPGVSASLNRFSTEDLATITGMFFDPARGRLYFTKSDSNQLHWRGFAPHSRVVGAQRFSSATGAGGVDWSAVRGMFMANGTLYTSSTSGALVARAWDAASGLPTGAATTVSGPAVDGDNWYARDSFVYAQAGVEVPNTAPEASFTSSCELGSCTFDGAASSDADGAVVSYSWNFGDGSTPGIGATASHVYTLSGTYTVTLTVTDNRGATGTTTRQVDVTVPNVNPTADFTSACTGLSCSFDSTGSVDPDGSIASRSWDLGDGTSSTEATPSHTYAAAGSYTVVLTVTDDAGATSTKTATVSVVDPNAVPTVSFRAAASSNTNSATPAVTVPASVQPGDVLVLAATLNSNTVTTAGPAGWTLLDDVADATATTRSAVWTRTATAGDAGSTVRLTSSLAAKTSMQVLAYSGAASVSAHAAAFDTVSRTDRTTPTVPVAVDGSAVISYWADKSSDSIGWSLPGDVTLRDQSIGTASGRIVAAIADSGPAQAGTAGGRTAVSSSLNRRGVAWSIVVAPPTGPANIAPTASFTTQCTALTCSVDAAGSTDPDGTIVSYAWSFGDGANGSGVTASRTYAAAGTYTVALTVTDDKGATATTTRQVTVAPPTATIAEFRAATGVNVNALAATLTVPASVQAGDVMVLIATVNNRTAVVTDPAGWTLLRSVSNASTDTQSMVWTRTATATDAGATVRMTNSVTSKVAFQLSAYRNASAVTALDVSFGTTSGTTRTTPVVPVTTSGSALVSYWADKSSATTNWTVAPGAELRNLSVGSGSGRITAALADSGSVSAGQAGGLSATADSATSRATMWSIVVAPSS